MRPKALRFREFIFNILNNNANNEALKSFMRVYKKFKIGL